MIAETTFNVDDITRLKRGLREIDYLLDHWDEKTLYCNFGEFQRELLTVENKQKLFDAAAKTGLLDYDKSATMNVLCRRDPEVVRAFLGLSPQNNPLLSRADVLMKKPTVINLLDPDDLDDYFSAVDKFTEAISSVDFLSYQARSSDFSSTQTTTKSEAIAASKESESAPSSKRDFLAQTKDSVKLARNALAIIVEKLKL